MLLPIYAYGQPVLKKKAQPLSQNYEGLKELISDMWDTMYEAQGVGLAAPQIGLSIRLFVVDTVQLKKEPNDDPGIKEVFINAEMIEEAGEYWSYEEGCLSIPNIRGDVERQKEIRIRYQNEQFEQKEAVFSGVTARVIQHEYDHIEGILFIEKLKPIRKTLIRKKLEKIKIGQAEADYRMRFVAMK
jgi:peptide deformylase